MLMLDILEKTDLRGLKVLDMGTGSGILAVAAAKKGALVLAVDIDKNAVEIAWKNAAANNTVIRYRCSDLFEKISERFDLIIFNAPYLPADDTRIQELPQWYGGPNGREIIERFLRSAKDFLTEHGKILLLISTITGEKEVKNILDKEGFGWVAIKREKIPWEELVVIAARINI